MLGLTCNIIKEKESYVSRTTALFFPMQRFILVQQIFKINKRDIRTSFFFFTNVSLHTRAIKKNHKIGNN